MGKKLAGTGAAGWLATVRKVFTPTAASNKDPRHAKKLQRGRAVESSAAAGGGGEAAAEVVSVEHFPPAAETSSSPEVTNDIEGVRGAVVWLEREDYGEVAAARSRRDHHRRRGVAAAEVASRVAAVRRRTGATEERAAVRIQVFYRGYLARRALRALRGLVRLQALVRGRLVRRQVHRTMRCMQALVRAQDRARAGRRLPSPYAAGARRACRPGPGVVDVAQRHPGLLVVPRHQHQHQHQRGEGGRRSFGLDAGDHQTQEQQHQDPPRRSNVSPPPNFLQETWGAVRAADGMLLRHDMSDTRAEIDPATYAYEFQRRRRQADELLEMRDESNAGWHWMESCTHTGGVHHPPQHAPQQTDQHHGAAETSYVTTEATTDAVSENTEAAEESTARDLYPHDLRPPVIPRYMTATQSARAKARMAPPPAAPSRTTHARTRSGSAEAPSGGSASTSSMGSWGVSHHNGGARAPQKRAARSPESSCSGDRMIPTQLGGWSRLAFASASQQHI